MTKNKIIIRVIEIYQKTLSPDHGFFGAGAMRCRFYPTCSEYTKQAIEKYGVLKGIGKGLLRILKCNPLFEGGVDLI